MISVSVEADIRNAIEDLRGLNVDVDRAASMALNKVAETAKSVAAREIAGAAALPLGKVRKRITVTRSSRYRLQAIVTGNSYSPNLGNYNAAQGAYGTGAVTPPGRPVFVGHAFILKKAGKPVMIRARQGGRRASRKPLESVRVEVLKRTWVHGVVNRSLQSSIATRWPIEFDRAIKAVSRNVQ